MHGKPSFSWIIGQWFDGWRIRDSAGVRRVKFIQIQLPQSTGEPHALPRTSFQSKQSSTLQGGARQLLNHLLPSQPALFPAEGQKQESFLHQRQSLLPQVRPAIQGQEKRGGEGGEGDGGVTYWRMVLA